MASNYHKQWSRGRVQGLARVRLAGLLIVCIHQVHSKKLMNANNEMLSMNIEYVY